MPSRYCGTSVSNGASLCVSDATVKTASGRWSRTYCALALLKALQSASRSGDSPPKRQLPFRSATTSQPWLRAIGPSAAMYCWAWESPSTTMRLVTVSGRLFCRQPASSGSLGTFPSVHSPSMSAHSFFIATGAGMILASGVGLPAFSGVRAAAPGVSSFGCAAAAASSAIELALPHGRPARPAGRRRPRSRRRCARRGAWASAIRAAASPRTGWSARPGRSTRRRCTGPGPGSGAVMPVPARASTSSGQCQRYRA